jgi:hypothetical protein
VLGKPLKTTIEGYEVELEIDPKSDPQTQCWIHYRRYHGSLAALVDMGVLYHNNTDDEHHVPAWIVAKIEEWALKNGY